MKNLIFELKIHVIKSTKLVNLQHNKMDMYYTNTIQKKTTILISPQGTSPLSKKIDVIYQLLKNHISVWGCDKFEKKKPLQLQMKIKNSAIRTYCASLIVTTFLQKSPARMALTAMNISVGLMPPCCSNVVYAHFTRWLFWKTIF